MLTSVATLSPAATPEEGAAQQSNCRRSTITGLLAKCPPGIRTQDHRVRKQSASPLCYRFLRIWEFSVSITSVWGTPWKDWPSCKRAAPNPAPKLWNPGAVGPQLCNLKDLRKKRIPGRIPGSGKIQVCGEPLWGLVEVLKSFFMRAVWSLCEGSAKVLEDCLVGFFEASVKALWRHCEGIVKILGRLCEGIVKALWRFLEGSVKIEASLKLLWAFFSASVKTLWRFLEGLLRLSEGSVKMLWGLCADSAKILWRLCEEYLKILWRLLWRHCEDSWRALWRSRHHSTNIKIPWMTLIHNSMIVLGVLYCVHLVLFIFVFTACLFPFSFSLIMLFLCLFIIYYMFFWKLYHHNIFQIYDPLF